MLVESSIWIAHARGTLTLDELGQPGDIAICPPVLFEVLRGTRPSTYDRWRQILADAQLLDETMPTQRFEEAAKLYIQCRDAGYTIRSSVDCLIAACAIAHNVELLHNDRDFRDFAAPRLEGVQAAVSRGLTTKAIALTEAEFRGTLGE